MHRIALSLLLRTEAELQKGWICMLPNHSAHKIFVSAAFVCLLLMAQCAFGTIIMYVDASASSGGNGLSWSSPYRFPADAIDYLVQHLGTSEPGEIHVAGGSYYPDHSNASPSGTSDRTASFHLIKNVKMLGHYRGLSAGTGQSPEDRVSTIISY